MPRPATTLFEDAIDVPMWLEADRLTPYPERVRRDREIARRLAPGRPLRRVRKWWQHAGAAAGPGVGARLERLRGLLTLGVAALGAVAGVALALAAFRYDGSQPVNVVRLMALLVGVQLVFLLLTLLLMPRGAPGLDRVREVLAMINPGGLAASLFRRLARAPPELARLFEGHATGARAGGFAKWQILYWSQVSAVAFNLAALATAVVLVTFTDLAFGWSTTLAADPATVSRLVEAIAWPWHAIVPSAVPDLALVRQSQFFRLAGGGDLAPGTSRALTGWWPFTLCAIVTYGLLPRLVLLAVAAMRLRAATAALLLEGPGVAALLDRMAAPAIETSDGGHGEDSQGTDAIPAAPAAPRAAGSARAVIWDKSVDPAAAREYARCRLNMELLAVGEAGGGRALDADDQTLAQLAAGEARTFVVFTPAWEPPLLEFLDFLGALRRRAGAAASIMVVPVADAGGVASAAERDTWARAVARLGDPRLYVEPGAP